MVFSNKLITVYRFFQEIPPGPFYAVYLVKARSAAD
jgi:hypothetical protein